MMRLEKRYWLIITIAFSVFLSCSKEPQHIETITPSENPYLLQVDSLEGNFLVYQLDSFVTSGKTSALIGTHADPVFGRTTANAYFKMTIPETAPVIERNTYYDSIGLIIKLNQSSYGDTTVPFTIVASRLNGDWSTEESSFYNNQSIPAGPVLGSSSAVIKPGSTDSILVKLDDALGTQLFGFFRENANQIKSNEAFQEYFKGIKLLAGAGVNTIYGLNFSTGGIVMRLYYHDDISVKDKKYVDFNLASDPYKFYSVVTDRTATPLAALATKKEIAATELGNQFYMQEFTGLRTRINFAGLRDVLKLSTYVTLLNAQLEIKPVLGTYGSYTLPPSINLYTLSEDNVLTGPMVNPSTQETQTGSLSIDQTYGKDTRYVFDVSAYAASQFTATAYTSQSIVLVQPEGETILKRLVAGTTSHQAYRSRLILNLFIYKK